MTLKLIVMLRATKIRMRRGESLEEILASYPKLSPEEKQTIRDNV